MKEIRILNELKCKSVVKVEGFCSQPLAVMLEYLPLIATPSPHAAYLDFIVSGDYVDQLASLQKMIAKDITSATAYLHEKDIVLQQQRTCTKKIFCTERLKIKVEVFQHNS